MQARQEVKALLLGTTLGEYLSTRPPSTVVTVDPTTPLPTALKLLGRSGILAAPVVQATDATFHGFIDVLDIMTALVDWAVELANGDSRQLTDAIASREVAERLAAARIWDIPRANDGQMVHVTHEGMSLLEVVQRGLIVPAYRLWCHRLAVFNGVEPGAPATSSGVVIKAIVSQSDIIRFLHRHLDQLPALRAARLPELALPPSSQVSVCDTLPTISALEFMLASGVTSVAVLGSDGTLRSALSASDLRGIQPQNLHWLALPVADFLKQPAQAGREWHVPGSTAQKLGQHSQKPLTDAIPPPVTCAPDALVGDVLGALVERKVHRIFVVAPDESQEQTSVLTAGLSPPPQPLSGAGKSMGPLAISDLLAALVA